MIAPEVAPIPTQFPPLVAHAPDVALAPLPAELPAVLPEFAPVAPQVTVIPTDLPSFMPHFVALARLVGILGGRRSGRQKPQCHDRSEYLVPPHVANLGCGFTLRDGVPVPVLSR